MRALTISAHGGLDQLAVHDVTMAAPGRGWVRVKLHAAALNHLDLWVVRGIPGVRITHNFVLGSDGSGIIDAVDDDVPARYMVREGDRVVINPGFATGDDEYVQRGDEPLSPSFGVLGEHHPGT